MKDSEAGFSLVELIVVVTVVGVLFAIAIPVYSDYRDRARITVVASELKQFHDAFYAYTVDTDSVFPNDTHLVLPAGMDKYINPSVWTSEIAIVGRYNWEGPDYYPYAGISIFASTAPTETFETLDQMLDDGNLNTGKFRIGTNGRPTYIVEETG